MTRHRPCLVAALLLLPVITGCSFSHRGRITVNGNGSADLASMEIQVSRIVGEVAQRHGFRPRGGSRSSAGEPLTMERGWVWAPADPLRSEPCLGIRRTGDGGIRIQIEMRSDSPRPGITGNQILRLMHDLDAVLRARFGDAQVSSSRSGFSNG